MSSGQARLLLALTALLFSTGGAVMKAIALPGPAIASLRAAIAGVALLVMLPAARARRPSLATALIGAGYAATMVTFVLANKLATGATAIFVQSLAPIYILPLSRWLLGERVHRRDLWFLAALGVGFALLFSDAQPTSTTAPDPALGRLLAFASGIGWAATVLGLRWLGRHDPQRGSAAPDPTPQAQALVLGNLLACLATAPAALPMPTPSLRDGALLLYLGIFQIGLAYALLGKGLTRVPALQASLILLLEPALNPLWTWLWHDERPGPLTLAAGGVILAATVVHALAAARSERRRVTC